MRGRGHAQEEAEGGSRELAPRGRRAGDEVGEGRSSPANSDACSRSELHSLRPTCSCPAAPGAFFSDQGLGVLSSNNSRLPAEAPPRVNKGLSAVRLTVPRLHPPGHAAADGRVCAPPRQGLARLLRRLQNTPWTTLRTLPARRAPSSGGRCSRRARN
jgi:hypothetical protein